MLHDLREGFNGVVLDAPSSHVCVPGLREYLVYYMPELVEQHGQPPGPTVAGWPVHPASDRPRNHSGDWHAGDTAREHVPGVAVPLDHTSAVQERITVLGFVYEVGLACQHVRSEPGSH